MQKHILLLLFAAFAAVSTAQTPFTEEYFAGNAPKLTGQILNALKTPDVAFVRATAPHRIEYPTEYLMAVNTDGSLRWNSFHWPVAAGPTLRFGDMILGSDGFLYVRYVEEGQHFLLKINALSGTVAWKATMPSGQVAERITERTAGEISVSLYIGFGSQSIIASFSRQNGALLRSHVVGTNPIASLASDASGALLYSFRDSLVKANGLDPTQQIWRSHIKVPFSSYDVNGLSRYVKTPDGQSILMYGAEVSNRGVYAHINLADGSVTNIGKTQAEGSIRDVVVRGDTVFSCWQHQYAGSGGFSLLANQLSTGALAYQRFFQVNVPGGNTPLYGASGSMGLDIDEGGSIYLTGYGNTANYEPGAWGMVKVRASDGEKIWDKVLDETPAGLDEFSTGRMVWCPANGKVWVAGEMQQNNNFNFNTPTCYEINPADGAILQQQRWAGDFRYNSATLQLLPAANGFFALKKKDNCAVVTRYDLTQQAVWERELCPAQYFRVGGLYPGKNNSLFVTTTNLALISGNLATDSFHLFKLDALTGNVQQRWRVWAGGGGYPLHVSAQTDTILWFMHEGVDRKLYRIIGNQVKPPVNIQSAVYEPLPEVALHRLFVERGRETFYRYSLNQCAVATPTAFEAYANPPVQAYVDGIAAVPNSPHVIAGGLRYGPFGGYGWSIFRYLPGADTAIWQKTGTTGVIQRIVVGSAGEVFTQGVESNTLYVKRFNIMAGQLLWEKTFTSPTGIPEIGDMVFDAASGQLLLSNTLRQVDGNRRVWLLQLDANGNTTAQTERDGDAPGPHNRALCALALPSGQVVVGGQMLRNGLDTAGFVWGLPDQFLSARGRVYLDLNDNAQADPDEPGWAQTVAVAPGNYLSFPDSLGAYRVDVLNGGAYQAGVLSPSPYFEVVKANFSLSGSQSNIAGANIRLRPTASALDAAVRLAEVSPARFGFATRLLVSLQNLGTLPTDSTRLALDCGPDLDLQGLAIVSGANVIPRQQTVNGTLTATLPGQGILATQHLLAQGQLNTFLSPGDMLVCTVQQTAFPLADAVAANDRDTLSLLVTGAYDPNDLTAYPGGTVAPATLAPDGSLDLTYRIRFENTGNAPTDFVRVENAYSPLLRPETFRLGAVSAPCAVRFLSGNRMEFSFPDYRLSAAAVDSLGAQGFVFYQMRSRPGLVLGDSLAGEAAIYFDFNPPITTNQAVTRIANPVATEEPRVGHSWRIYPNPAPEGARLRFSESVAADAPWWLFSAEGRLVGYGSAGAGIVAPRPGLYQVWCGGVGQWLVVVR